MTHEAFDVVVLPFPYSDKLAEQRRPTLVVSRPDMTAAAKQLWVAMITTSRRNRFGDATIFDLAEAGLPLASRLRASKLATVEVEHVIRRVGALSERDRAAARVALEAYAAF